MPPPDVPIEMLMAWHRCGLQAKYMGMGAQLEDVDDRDVVIRCTRDCIREYFREAVKPGSHPKMAQAAATAMLHRYIAQDRTNFTVLMNNAFDTLKRMDYFVGSAFNPFEAVPVLGPQDRVLVSFPEGVIRGDVCGAAILDAETSNARLAVFFVYPSNRFISPDFRLQQGFCKAFIEEHIALDWKGKVITMQIDPLHKEITEHVVSQEEVTQFEGFARAFLRSIWAKSYPARPGAATCDFCSFKPGCRLEHSSPDEPNEEGRMTFLRAIGQ